MHLRVNEHGLPLQIELSPGQAHDAPMAELLLQDLPKGTSLLADRGYDADWMGDDRRSELHTRHSAKIKQT